MSMMHVPYLLLLQGCDASVLLTGNNTELNAVPNQTLRPVALDLIERIRAAVHRACGPTVSCADITVLATRDALVQVHLHYTSNQNVLFRSVGQLFLASTPRGLFSTLVWKQHKRLID